MQRADEKFVHYIRSIIKNIVYYVYKLYFKFNCAVTQQEGLEQLESSDRYQVQLSFTNKIVRENARIHKPGPGQATDRQ